MTIALDKILTISARDYCDMHGKSLTDYEERGVHIEEPDSSELTILESFAQKVPEEAEIIVAYQQQIISEEPNDIYFADGTALIPKIPKDSHLHGKEGKLEGIPSGF